MTPVSAPGDELSYPTLILDRKKPSYDKAIPRSPFSSFSLGKHARKRLKTKTSASPLVGVLVASAEKEHPGLGDAGPIQESVQGHTTELGQLRGESTDATLSSTASEAGGSSIRPAGRLSKATHIGSSNILIPSPPPNTPQQTTKSAVIPGQPRSILKARREYIIVDLDRPLPPLPTSTASPVSGRRIKRKAVPANNEVEETKMEEQEVVLVPRTPSPQAKKRRNALLDSRLKKQFLAIYDDIDKANTSPDASPSTHLQMGADSPSQDFSVLEYYTVPLAPGTTVLTTPSDRVDCFTTDQMRDKVACYSHEVSASGNTNTSGQWWMVKEPAEPLNEDSVKRPFTPVSALEKILNRETLANSNELTLEGKRQSM